MAKVSIEEDLLNEARGAMEDIVGAFTRGRYSSGLPPRWFVEVEVLGGTNDMEVGDRLADALERAHKTHSKLADYEVL